MGLEGLWVGRYEFGMMPCWMFEKFVNHSAAKAESLSAPY